MKLLWVKADKIGSKIIRWGLNSDCSHFGISFDEDEQGRGIAFHSYGVGTQLEWLREFKKKYTIVHSLTPSWAMTLQEEENVYKAILDEEAGRLYDYAGISFFALIALRNKMTGKTSLPTSNSWQKDNMRLCTGIAPTVFKALGIIFPPNVDVEMITPLQLLDIAKKSGKLI